MPNTNSMQKIKIITNAINKDFDQQPAKKVVSKLYDLATTIHKKYISIQEENHKYDKQDHLKQELSDNLRTLREYFIRFKKQRKDEITKFNQVEYYMFQQTQKILKQHENTIVKLVYDKILSISQIFIKHQSQTPKSFLSQFSDTNGSSSSDKNALQARQNQQKLGIKHNKHNKQTDCTQIWRNVIELYKNHRLDQAFNQVKIFQNLIHQNHREMQLKIEQVELMQTIYFEHKTMSEFYSHFYDTGYTFDKEEKGISLWHKIIGEKDVAIKVQAQIQISIQNFLCISSQIDLFQDYMPFTYDTKQEKSISRNEKIGSSKVYIPLLTDRQTYFYAAAYDLLRTKGSIFFLSKTINEDYQYQRKYQFEVPKNSKYIRLDYKYYILEYIPLSRTRGKVRMVSSIDLKMDYLPLFIINKSARIFSFDYMKNYRRINKKFEGSKWDQMKKRKKQMYNYFQEKINEYLQESNS